MNTDSSARPVLDSEVAEWKSAVGRTRKQEVMTDAEVLWRFALATGAEPDVERFTPLLSHWALFLDAVSDARIGEDGHPLRGDFLPAVHLPRRMFASADLTFRKPLKVGLGAECLSTVTAVTHKRGQTGDLVFVNVQREIGQGGETCVSEQQTIVYRAAGERVAAIPENELQTQEHEIWKPGPVQLFRFSAVTFNSHRIHFDLPYAQKEEGYPGLVVHGPFTAIKLLDYACRRTGRVARSMRFRGVAPLFASQPIRLFAGEETGTFIAQRCDGTSGMTAQVDFS